MKLNIRLIFIIFISIILFSAFFYVVRPAEYIIDSSPSQAEITIEGSGKKHMTPTTLYIYKWKTLLKITLKKTGYDDLTQNVDFSKISGNKIFFSLVPSKTTDLDQESFSNPSRSLNPLGSGVTKEALGKKIKNPYYIKDKQQQKKLVFINQYTNGLEFLDGSVFKPLLLNEFYVNTGFAYSPKSSLGVAELFDIRTSQYVNSVISFSAWGPTDPPKTIGSSVKNGSYGFSWNPNGDKLSFFFSSGQPTISTVGVADTKTQKQYLLDKIIIKGGQKTYFPRNDIILALAEPHDGQLLLEHLDGEYKTGIELYVIKQVQNSWQKTTLSDDVYSGSVSISPNNKKIAYFETNKVVVYDLNADTKTKIPLDPNLINNVNRSVVFQSDNILVSVYKISSTALIINQTSLETGGKRSFRLLGWKGGNLAEVKFLSDLEIAVVPTNGGVMIYNVPLP